MKVRKVLNYIIPIYPDKDMLKCDPSLLVAFPKRWIRNVAAYTAAVTTTAILLTSCNTADKATNRHLDIPFFDKGFGKYYFPMLLGRYTPAYLTEDDAFSVISDEAKKEGLHFKRTKIAIDEIQLPVGKPDAQNHEVFDGNRRGKLVLDGFDKTYRIGFEFVSCEDANFWGQDKRKGRIYYDIVDIRSGAMALSDGVKNTSTNMAVAVFYDPVRQNVEALDEDKQIEIKEQTEEDLREQVRDFIAWLKAEGII